MNIVYVLIIWHLGATVTPQIPAVYPTYQECNAAAAEATDVGYFAKCVAAPERR
jgi:hypothetical protein